MKKYAFYLVGLIFLMILLMQTNWTELITHMRTLNTRTLLLLLGLQIITVLLIGLQWSLLATHIQVKLSFLTILKMNFAGTLFESITPAVKTGGEAYKLVYLKKQGFSAAKSISLIGTQKLFSLFGFLCMMLLTLLFFYAFEQPSKSLNPYLQSVWYVIVGLLIITIITVALCNVKLKQKTRLATFIQDLKSNLKPLMHAKRYIPWHLLLSLLIWALYVFKVLVVAHATGLALPVLYAALAVYLAYTVALLPLTPGGIGTFEGTFAGVLSVLGYSLGSGLFMAVMLRLATFWFALLISVLGLLMFNVKHKQKRWWQLEQPL